MEHCIRRISTNKFLAFPNSWPVSIVQSIAFLAVLLFTSISQVDAQSQVRIRLKNNGFVAGKLVTAELDDHIAIQCNDFTDPLHLHVQAVLSVNQLERNGEAEVGKQIFVLTSGMSIAGTLTGLDEQLVTIQSPSLGTVNLPRALLREFSDVNYAGRLVYSGPRSGQDWNGENPEDWVFEAGAIASSKANATIIGDVNLPDKCEVRLSLSWTRTPDFVLSLGCNNATKTDSAALK